MFSLDDSEILSKTFEATMLVVFHIKITASIWKKQLVK